MKRLHQNVVIDGEPLPAEKNERAASNFWNEGKWRNFILPLLPEDPSEKVFVEVGCNAGLFLALAKQYGFDRVVGVDADLEACDAACRYRDSLGLDYKVLWREVGDDFDWDELPVADVVLLANVHYYIHMEHWLPFLDRMRWKTVDCIVVSRAMKQKKHGHPLPELDALRLMFEDWETVRVIPTSSKMLDGDPARRKMHSVLFRSKLRRHPLSDHTATGTVRYEKQQEFIDMVRSRQYVPLEETRNWAYWVQRKQVEKEGSQRWTDAQVREHVEHRFELVRDIMENGVKEPIIARPDRVGIDGGNRAGILKLLGYKTVIVRTV